MNRTPKPTDRLDTRRAARRPRAVVLGLAACIALAAAGCSSPEDSGDTFFDNPAYRDGLATSLELYQRGDLRGALKPAVAALLVAPDRDEPYARISTIYVDMGLDDEAAAFFAKTAERFPDLVSPHRYLGFHEFRRGNWDEALAAYRTVAELDPRNAEAHFRQGLILQAQGAFDEAADALRLALELDPQNAITAARLSRVLRITGETDEARDVVERTLRDVRNSPDLLFARGVLDARDGNLERAESSLRGAIDLRPDYREAHEELGKLLIRAGREDEGRRHTVRAERLRDYVDLKNRLTSAVARDGGADRLLALAELELTEGRTLDADRWLDRAATSGGPSWRIAVARAEGAFARRNAAAGHAVLDAIDAETGGEGDGSAEAIARIDLARAAGLVAENRTEEAVEALDDVVERGPAEREWLRRAADLYAAAGAPERADALNARASEAENVADTIEDADS